MTEWYKIKVPKNIVARPVDTVSYTATEYKTGKKTVQKGAACYHEHMATLPLHSFDCVPYHSKQSILSPEDFFLWMKFCTAFGLCPPSTFPYTKGESNCAIIEGKGDSKHRIYAGLCCYRWSEALAPMCYEACRLIEARPDIDFYRIFHYVTGKYVTLVGHSFTNVTAAAMAMYGRGCAKNARLDHSWGLGVKMFFQHNSDGICPALGDKSNKSFMTQSAIQNFIQKLGLVLPVKNHENLLDDKWAELYNLPELKKENIQACYEKLKNKALLKEGFICY